MTKQNLWMYVGAVLVIALFTFGCGGDDGLSAADQARIDQAEADRMEAQAAQAAAEADAAREKTAREQAEADRMEAQEAQEAAAAAADLASIRAREVVDALDGAAPDGNTGIVEIGFDAMGDVDIMGPDGRAWDDVDPLAEFTDWTAASHMRDTRRTRPDGTEAIHLYTAKLDGRTDEFENVYELSDMGALTIGLADPMVRSTMVITPDSGTESVMIGNVLLEIPATIGDLTSGRVLLGHVNGTAASSRISFDRAFGSDDTVTIDDAGGTDGEGGEPGSFHGVEGTFYCSGADPGCTVEKDGDNYYLEVPLTVASTPVGGTTDDNDHTITGVTVGETRVLTFVPDDDDDHVQIAPESYLAWGAWFEKPEDADREHRFDAFYESSAGAVDEDAMMDMGLDGQARYTGGAVGKWATQDLAANTAAAGYFTADVNLTADFDAGELDDLSGRIRDFEENGESLGNWYVDLEMGGTAEAKVGRATIDGEWDHSMYGQLEADDMEDRHPAAVLGTFQLGDDGDPALLSGAFGTLNTDLD